MSPQQLKLVIDSIVWAFRHTERNVADTGLNLLSEMLTMFDKSDVATQFYQTYYMSLIREIFAVLTGKDINPFKGASMMILICSMLFVSWTNLKGQKQLLRRAAFRAWSHERQLSRGLQASYTRKLEVQKPWFVLTGYCFAGLLPWHSQAQNNGCCIRKIRTD